jgi:hypothetical protein
MRRKRKPESPGCSSMIDQCRAASLPSNPTLGEIVRDYRKRHKPVANYESDLFRNCPSLGRAIEYAGSAEDGVGRRFDHQRRITQTAIAESLARLRRSTQGIRGCRSFTELHELLEEVFRPIFGIGDLYIYDTTVRLGLKLGLVPDREYLHAGTREGAKNLGLDVGHGPLTVDRFPSSLRKLSAGELEDVLCIYKKHLKGALAREVAPRD